VEACGGVLKMRLPGNNLLAFAVAYIERHDFYLSENIVIEISI
jgi:hypothetical protein